MSSKEEFDYFVEHLLDNAVNDFQATEQYQLLQEKLKRMDADCEMMLREDERGFVTECFELILDTRGQQEHHVYRQGLLDGVKVLKWMGVLA